MFSNEIENEHSLIEKVHLISNLVEVFDFHHVIIDYFHDCTSFPPPRLLVLIGFPSLGYKTANPNQDPQ